MGVQDLLKFGLCQYVQKKCELKDITALGHTRFLYDASILTHMCSDAQFYIEKGDRQAAQLLCNRRYAEKIETLRSGGVAAVHFVFDGGDLLLRRPLIRAGSCQTRGTCRIG